MTEYTLPRYPSDDPLGIRNVRLGGCWPSLETEARIAVREWATREGAHCLVHIGCHDDPDVHLPLYYDEVHILAGLLEDALNRQPKLDYQRWHTVADIRRKIDEVMSDE